MSSVAERYASALFEVAEEANAIDAVSDSLKQFGALIEASPDLGRLVRNPVFTAGEQLSAVSAILDKAGIGGIAGNFIKLIASKRRLFALSGMIAAYEERVAQSRGIVRAEVTVAEAPSEAQLADITATLKQAAGRDVAVDLKVDPAIIGGLVVKMGSRMVDASLRTKLNSIRLAMKEVG